LHYLSGSCCSCSCSIQHAACSFSAAVVAALISAVETITAKAKILIIVCDGDDDSSWEEVGERCRVRIRERAQNCPCTGRKNPQQRKKIEKKMNPLIQFSDMYLQRSSKETKVEKNESINPISRYVS